MVLFFIIIFSALINLDTLWHVCQRNNVALSLNMYFTVLAELFIEVNQNTQAISYYFALEYRKVPPVRPPMVHVFVKSGLNSEQVSLMRHIYIEKCILVVLINFYKWSK